MKCGRILNVDDYNDEMLQWYATVLKTNAYLEKLSLDIHKPY